MVDKCGNELEHHSTPVESVATQKVEEDDSPPTREELLGLRAVARAIPELAQELDEERYAKYYVLATCH